MVRVRGCRAAGLLAVAIFAAAGAFAQDLVFEGERITADDIDQRSKFDQLATHKAPPREQVIDELRREALALGEARRYGIEVVDAEVEQVYANMAARMHMTAEQLTAALVRQGVDARTLKRKIRADLAWAQFVRGRHGLVPSTDPGLRIGPSTRPDPPTDPRRCLPCFPDNDAAAQAQTEPWRSAPMSQPMPAPGSGGSGTTAGPRPEQQKCLQELASYRTEADARAREAATESKKAPTRARICDLVSVTAAAELAWIKFAETNMTKCGLSQRVIEQMKTAHAGTVDVANRMCAPVPQTGPRWCRDCKRISDADPGMRVPRRGRWRMVAPAARDVGSDITDAEVDEAIAGMARRTHMTPARLDEALVHRGYDPAAQRELVRSEMKMRRQSNRLPPQQ
jgi:hypothetical protein